MGFNEDFETKYGFAYDNNKTFFDNVFGHLKDLEDKEIADWGQHFQSSLWESTIESRKIDDINKFMDFLAKYFKVKKIPSVKFEQMEENYFGGYLNNVITLNTLHLWDGEEVATTLVHEISHRVQEELISEVTRVEKGIVGKIADVVVKWGPKWVPGWISKIAFEKRVFTYIVNPKRLPVEKYRKEFNINQNNLKYQTYIALGIEMNAFNAEVEFARRMFGRMTENQARKFADFAGENGYGQKKNTKYGQSVVMERDKKGNCLCFFEEDIKRTFFVENQWGEVVCKHSNYVDMYKQFEIL
ncbi:hypothetical protein BTJ45_01152 [Bacillus mycoides]|nr:hypothetical protein BTJ45_01152 [Bacillus mycoides]